MHKGVCIKRNGQSQAGIQLFDFQRAGVPTSSKKRLGVCLMQECASAKSHVRADSHITQLELEPSFSKVPATNKNRSAQLHTKSPRCGWQTTKHATHKTRTCSAGPLLWSVLRLERIPLREQRYGRQTQTHTERAHTQKRHNSGPPATPAYFRTLHTPPQSRLRSDTSHTPNYVREHQKSRSETTKSTMNVHAAQAHG